MQSLVPQEYSTSKCSTLQYSRRFRGSTLLLRLLNLKAPAAKNSSKCCVSCLDYRFKWFATNTVKCFSVYVPCARSLLLAQLAPTLPVSFQILFSVFVALVKHMEDLRALLHFLRLHYSLLRTLISKTSEPRISKFSRNKQIFLVFLKLREFIL